MGRDMVNSPVNIYGLTPEQVQDLTKAAVAGAVGPLTDRIVDLSSTLGVTQGAAVTMLRIIGQQDVPLEKLPQKLAEVAEQYKSAMERLASLDPQDPMTRDLIGRAAAAIKAGHLDDADQLVSHKSWLRAYDARGAGERDSASGAGGRSLPCGARGGRGLLCGAQRELSRSGLVA